MVDLIDWSSVSLIFSLIFFIFLPFFLSLHPSLPSFFLSLTLSLSFSIYLFLFLFTLSLGGFSQLHLPAFLLRFFSAVIFFISKSSFWISDCSFLIAFCSCFKDLLKEISFKDLFPQFCLSTGSIFLFHAASFLSVVSFFGCLFTFKSGGLSGLECTFSPSAIVYVSGRFDWGFQVCGQGTLTGRLCFRKSE